MVIEQKERERYVSTLKNALDLLNSNEPLDCKILLKTVEPLNCLFTAKFAALRAVEAILKSLNSKCIQTSTVELIKMLEPVKSFDEKIHSKCLTILEELFNGDYSLHDSISEIEGLYNQLL